MSTAHVLSTRKFERPHMCRRRSRAGARHNVPGWELFGRARGSNAGRGARGGAFGSGSRKPRAKRSSGFRAGRGGLRVTLGKRCLPWPIWALIFVEPGPQKTGTVCDWASLAVGSSRRWRESDVFPRIVSGLTCCTFHSAVRPSLRERVGLPYGKSDLPYGNPNRVSIGQTAQE